MFNVGSEQTTNFPRPLKAERRGEGICSSKLVRIFLRLKELVG
jgi:hypothetical protein